MKKVCGPKKPRWKKMWNQRWRPINGCDNSSVAEILITTIQVNLQHFDNTYILGFYTFCFLPEFLYPLLACVNLGNQHLSKPARHVIAAILKSQKTSLDIPGEPEYSNRGKVVGLLALLFFSLQVSCLFFLYTMYLHSEGAVPYFNIITRQLIQITK